MSTVVQLSAYRPDPPSEARGPDELDEPVLAEDLLAIGRLLQTFMQEVAASNLGPRSKVQVLDQSRSASALLLEAAHILRGSLTARLEPPRVVPLHPDIRYAGQNHASEPPSARS